MNCCTAGISETKPQEKNRQPVYVSFVVLVASQHEVKSLPADVATRIAVPYISHTASAGVIQW
jgi:hypothetical protein